MTEEKHNHQLGGTRKSSPIDDEISYPLTNDEYLTLKENLSFDKFSNLESFLLSTFFSTLISTILFGFSCNFTKVIVLNGIESKEIDIPQVFLITMYAAISIGTLIGFFISKNNKKTSKKPFERLDEKINNHLNKSSHE
jgi:hypothetical protein